MDWSPFVRDHFSALAAAQGTSGPVGVLVGLLASGELSEGAYEAHVSQHGLGREEGFRKQRLDLILGFVERALEQGPLTPERQQEIARLKLALKVAEGEFAAFRPAEIATILREQLAVVPADGEIDGCRLLGSEPRDGSSPPTAIARRRCVSVDASRPHGVRRLIHGE